MKRDPAIAQVMMEQGFALSREWRLEEALACFRRARNLFLVRHDLAETAQRILQTASLFPMAVASELLSRTNFLFMRPTRYKLRKNVQRDWARAMLTLVVVGAALRFAN